MIGNVCGGEDGCRRFVGSHHFGLFDKRGRFGNHMQTRIDRECLYKREYYNSSDLDLDRERSLVPQVS